MNSRFDELIGTFRSILPIPETDRRYRLCLEAEDIFDTVMKRLEEIFGTEEAGRIIRDST